MPQILNNVLPLLLALFGLGLLVFIHELGHYWMAKKVGMRVEAFAVGFGKPIFKWHRSGVDWQLGWIPFGGFVRIAGTEKQGSIPVHKIQDGFFGKRPIDRLLVAVAGPLVNIVFAFLMFSVIFFIGGRVKEFAAHTHVIGSGQYPGSSIEQFGGRPYHGFKDLIYAKVFHDRTGMISGERIEYPSLNQTPFSTEYYEGFASSPASYLYYNSEGASKDAPIAQSGILNGDRIVWLNGEFTFSLPQIQQILNEKKAFLTIKRGNGEIYTKRVSKFGLREFAYMPTSEEDWLRENAKSLGIKEEDLSYLPYEISSQGVILKPLLIGHPEKLPPLDERLSPGDAIIAVDGMPISSQKELLEALQKTAAVMIVQRDVKPLTVSWKGGDTEFFKSLDWKEVAELASQVGSGKVMGSPNLVLLTPVVTQKAEALMSESNKQAYYQEIEKIKDPEQRGAALNKLKMNVLGVLGFADGHVIYNPTPTFLFGEVVVDMGRTLSALFQRAVSPSELSGPIGIIGVMQQGCKSGLGEALFWLAFVSLNLGLLNLLPIPVLDGGTICFSIYEMLTGKRLKPETIHKLTIPFVVLLIGFFIFVTFHDIMKLIPIDDIVKTIKDFYRQ